MLAEQKVKYIHMYIALYRMQAMHLFTANTSHAHHEHVTCTLQVCHMHITSMSHAQMLLNYVSSDVNVMFASFAA